MLNGYERATVIKRTIKLDAIKEKGEGDKSRNTSYAKSYLFHML
jgi:hypothetical protein